MEVLQWPPRDWGLHQHSMCGKSKHSDYITGVRFECPAHVACEECKRIIRRNELPRTIALDHTPATQYVSSWGAQTGTHLVHFLLVCACIMETTSINSLRAAGLYIDIMNN